MNKALDMVNVWRKGIYYSAESKRPCEPGDEKHRFVITTFSSLYYFQNFGIELFRTKIIENKLGWFVRASRLNDKSIVYWEGVRDIFFEYLEQLEELRGNTSNLEIIYISRIGGTLIESFSSIELNWGPRNPKQRSQDIEISNIIDRISEKIEERIRRRGPKGVGYERHELKL